MAPAPASRISPRKWSRYGLVTAAGEVLELSPETDPEAYLAARVSVARWA